MASPSETPLVGDVVKGVVEGLTNITLANSTLANSTLANGTAAASSSSWGLLGNLDFMLLESKLVFTAVAIIFIGAHGALRRPPSAAPPPQKTKNGKQAKKPEDDHFTEGLQASDAIMFPLLAGVVLIGLYYLIKWLQDPAILNKILRGYMSVMGVVSTGKLSGDTIQFAMSLVFPDYWIDGQGRIFHIDPRKRRQWLLKSPGAGDSDRELDEKKDTPLPDALSKRLSISKATKNTLWKIRHLLTEEWSVRLALRGIIKESFDVKLASVIGYLFGLVITTTYLMTNSSLLSNLLGAAFCYAAFMIMSTTSFAIGSMVLAGLFVYDIVMVFYTPFMITVATKIEAPIKLTFESNTRASLLGLGDIVVPGIFICLALRFDLWRHYQSHAKYVPTELETVREDAATKNAITTVETQYRTVRLTFVDPQGHWGDRFWTTPWSKLFCANHLKALKDASFPKPYFCATMGGYLLGMIATLIVLLVFKHGQPALLYLVPGVVGSAWLTGFLRGELKDMWKYTEDGSLDVEDVVVELDGNGNVIKEIEQPPKKKAAEEDGKAADKSSAASEAPSDTVKKSDEKTVSEVAGAGETSEEDSKATGDEKKEHDTKAHRRSSSSTDGYDVFVLRISAPGTGGNKED